MTLTDAQLVLLCAAAQRGDGLLVPPDGLGGRALDLTITKLVKADLVEAISVSRGDPAWSIDGDGFPIGLKITTKALSELGIIDANVVTLEVKPAPRQPRPGSKRACVMALLSRAEGATVAEITAATEWLPHTVRALLSGLRKAGCTIERERQPERGTVYRVAAAPVEPVASAEVC